MTVRASPCVQTAFAGPFKRASSPRRRYAGRADHIEHRIDRNILEIGGHFAIDGNDPVRRSDKNIAIGRRDISFDGGLPVRRGIKGKPWRKRKCPIDLAALAQAGDDLRDVQLLLIGVDVSVEGDPLSRDALADVSAVVNVDATVDLEIGPLRRKRSDPGEPGHRAHRHSR